MNPTTLGLVTGLGAAALLGYCVYFDRKRRSAPDFKAKLREKRRMAAKKAAMSKGPQLPGNVSPFLSCSRKVFV
jgi:import receptor subunit TOM20